MSPCNSTSTATDLKRAFHRIAGECPFYFNLENLVFWAKSGIYDCALGSMTLINIQSTPDLIKLINFRDKYHETLENFIRFGFRIYKNLIANYPSRISPKPGAPGQDFLLKCLKGGCWTGYHFEWFPGLSLLRGVYRATHVSRIYPVCFSNSGRNLHRDLILVK